jgi:anaerobic glycerol-3-phosphate dehydrogenase
MFPHTETDEKKLKETETEQTVEDLFLCGSVVVGFEFFSMW